MVLFQFLVVRLEVKPLFLSLLINDISIPCGAIRRPQRQNNLPVWPISIPCGAIRSVWLLVKFQHKNLISIPCGAIRRLSASSMSLKNLISIPCGAIRSRRNRRQKKLIFSFLVFCFLRFLLLKVVDVQKYEKPCTSTTNVFVCFSVCQRTYHDGNEQVFSQNTVLRQPPKENYRYYRVLYQ